MEGFYAVWPDSRGNIAPKLILFRSIIVKKFFALLNRFIEHHAAYLLHNLPQISSRMVIQILVKISHIIMDFVISPASDRIILGFGPQLCITWI